MSKSLEKLQSKLLATNDALDELEDALEPLLARPLAETLSELDNAQKAQMNVLLPYIVYDLIFSMRLAHKVIGMAKNLSQCT